MAWLSGWQYRKKITISGSSGAGTNYQVLLKVGENYSTWQASTAYSLGKLVKPTAGSNSFFYECTTAGTSGTTEPTWPTTDGATVTDGSVVWTARKGVTLDGHSANFPSGKNQGGDLRFTADDGTTLLNFYVAKVSGSSPNRIAYIVVKVGANLDNNVDIYCYYGNSDATNYSNGDNTYIFFDDFEGTTLDGNKWVTYGGLNYSVANSIIAFNGSSQVEAGINTSGKVTFSGQKYVVEFRMKKSSSNRAGFFKFNRIDGNDVIYDGEETVSNYGHYLGKIGTNFGQQEVSTGSPTTDWREHKVIINGTAVSGQRGTDIFGSMGDDLSVTLNISFDNYNYYLYLAGWNYPYDQFDWVRVRKYVSPEPAFSSAGSEETSSGLYTITITETLSLGEGITRFSQKVVNEIVNLTESIIKFPQKLVSEAINLLESVGIFRFFEKILMETLSLTDSISKSVGKLLTEMISLGETIIKISQKIITETINLGEIIIKKIETTISEGIELVEDIIKSPQKVLTETLLLADSISKFVKKLLLETINLIESTIAKAYGLILPIKPVVSKIKMRAKGLATFFKVRGKSKQL